MSRLVTIGLPVFNGGPTVGAAIQSVLDQDYEHIELVISDNGSTDATPEICEHFASTDSRVRFFRNASNVGAKANFNRVFELSSGDYFKWIGHDDVLDPSVVATAVAILDNHPSLSIVHWLERMTDSTGTVLREYASHQAFAISGRTAGSRFRQMLFWRKNGFDGDPIYGVIRRAALEQTRMLTAEMNPNYLLLQELSLTGGIFTVPEVLATRVYNDVRTTAPRLLTWLDPGRSVGFPHFRRAREYFRVGTLHPSVAFCDRLLNVVALVGYHSHPREVKGFLWDLSKGRFAPR